MPAQQPRSIFFTLQFIWLNLWFWMVAPLYSLVFFSGMLAATGILRLVARNPRKTSWFIRRSLNYYGLGILKCGWPLVRVQFVDFAPDEKPPFVFVSNHPSSSDGFLMAYVWFEAVQVLNIWPNRVPIMRSIAKHASYISIREMPFEEFLATGSKLLSEGCSIIAFPEGTRSGAREMGPFHGSAFRLAQHNKVKIVPLVLAGNKEIPPRGSALLRPGHIVMSKLPAVRPDQYEGVSAFVLKNMIRARIQDHLLTQTAATS